MKENKHWDLGSVGVNVDFRTLEKSIWVLEKPWKFVSEKGYEPWKISYKKLPNRKFGYSSRVCLPRISQKLELVECRAAFLPLSPRPRGFNTRVCSRVGRARPRRHHHYEIEAWLILLNGFLILSANLSSNLQWAYYPHYTCLLALSMLSFWEKHRNYFRQWNGGHQRLEICLWLPMLVFLLPVSCPG